MHALLSGMAVVFRELSTLAAFTATSELHLLWLLNLMLGLLLCWASILWWRARWMLQFHEQLLEGSPVAECLVDVEVGLLIRSNVAARRLLGIQSSVQRVNFYGAMEAAAAGVLREQLLSVRKAAEREVQMHSAQDTAFWVSLTAAAYECKGRLVAKVVFFDISARREGRQ